MRIHNSSFLIKHKNNPTLVPTISLQRIPCIQFFASMKKSQIIFSSPWLTFLIGLWLYNFLYTNFAASQCMNYQKSLLLHLQNNLKYYDSYDYPDTIVRWNESTDCCLWNGVECDLGGRVTGLDLSQKNIVGGIDNSSSLFRLQFLQRLNLADNDIKGKIPSALGKLSSLTYLNLSKAGFSGQVPIEISQLSKLIVLDISKQDYEEDRLYMKRPNLTTIIQNLTNMRELILDGVDNSAMGISWCDALSSSLPHLQVLSMSSCDLRGDIYKSLLKLKHLSVISLSFNPLEGPLPEFLTTFTNLTTLECQSCSLTGKVPMNIFNIPTLKTIDLSNNEKLQGILPVFYKNGSLEEIDLSYSDFSGVLPKSIGNIKRLRKIDLSGCEFRGSIPSSMGNLKLLEYVDLCDNQFFGHIPSFSSAKKLNFLALCSNNLSGSISSTDWGELINLDLLDFSYNSLDGSIPIELFSLPLLRIICLDHNKFSGPLREFEIMASSNLNGIDLNNNNLEGPLPNSIFRLTKLEYLQLYSNKFNGTLKLRDFLQNLIHLDTLDLSHNGLSIDTDDCSANSSFSNYVEIRLASCNLGRVPEFIRHQIELSALDLSKNHIVGGIPRWICNATNLQLLNLQYNHFNQTIPDCLFTMTELDVLNLRANRFTGGIPTKFENSRLKTLDLNGNFLQGQIPISLANSTSLEVLDLGHNQFYDTFPCHLESVPNLQVLVLRSNKFKGTMLCPGNNSVWQQIRIMDLASNHFSGKLTAQIFLNFRSMMVRSIDQGQSRLDQLSHYTPATDDYYEDAEELTFKGYAYWVQKNLGIFIAIDFSDNSFHGELPKELGNLNALIVLNFSHNSLSGNIPSSFGNLSFIKSLDLSCNYLSGKIPPQFANLNFLEYLNLSYNKLSGKIPTGTQLQSFSASSYEGNQGLYGPPLTPVIGRKTYPSIPLQGYDWSLKSWLEWMIRGAEVGFPVGFSIVIVPLLYIKRWREWYYKNLNILIMKILHKEDNTRRRRQQRHRH